ncbi:MAG: protein kinase, partial [Nanoarchaeota archaeon]
MNKSEQTTRKGLKKSAVSPLDDYLPLEGKLFGSKGTYVVKDIISASERSGMRTCLALNLNTAEYVVIKEFPTQASDSFMREDYVQRVLQREGGQQNILSAVDIIRKKNTSRMNRIIFPYAPEGDLKKLSPQGMPLEPALTKRVAVSICDALDYLHKRGITHRDVKDTNILVNPEAGQEGIFKLSDFDICWHEDLQHLDQPSTIAGSQLYMAPEVALFEKPASKQRDIYATGVLLYKILAGEYPFYPSAKENEMDFYSRILQQPVPDHPEISPRQKIV